MAYTFVQYQSPFEPMKNILEEGKIYSHIGIQAPYKTLFLINGDELHNFYEIGLTGILEFNDCNITSIIVLNDLLGPMEAYIEGVYKEEDNGSN